MRNKFFVWLILLTVLCTSVFANLNDNLVNYWSFNSGVVDSIQGKSFNTLYGSPIQESAGGISSGYVYLHKNASLQSDSIFWGQGNFTIVYWSWLNDTISTGRGSVESSFRCIVNNPNVQSCFFNYVSGGDVSTLYSTNNAGNGAVSNSDSFPVVNNNLKGWFMTAIVYNGTDFLIAHNGSSYVSDVRTAYDYKTNLINSGLIVGRHEFPTNSFSNLTLGIDELGFWNRSLSLSELDSIFVNKLVYPFTDNLSILSPENGDFNNSDVNFFFNFSSVSGVSGYNNCSLWDNRTSSWSRRSVLYNALPHVVYSFSNTHIDSVSPIGSYIYNIYCENDSASYFVSSSNNFSLIIDSVSPIVDINFPRSDNSSRLSSNLTVNISVNDQHNFETDINLTSPSGLVLYSAVYSTVGFSNYSIFSTFNLTNLSDVGNFTLIVSSADGHTAHSIKPINNEVVGNELRFNDESFNEFIDSNDSVVNDLSRLGIHRSRNDLVESSIVDYDLRIKPLDDSLFSSAEIIQQFDRYNFNFFSSNDSSSYVGSYDFVVESKGWCGG